MSCARTNRALAIAEAWEAERAEHAESVRAAREAERTERNREPVEPPDVSGGLDPMGIGDDGSSELAEWYRSISGAASRRPSSGILYLLSSGGEGVSR